MSDWIKRRAEESRENEKNREANHEWQIHRANTIKANAKPVWDRVISNLEQAAGKFNEEFSNTQLRITFLKSPSGEITIRRNYYPTILATIQPLRDSGPIRYSISMTKPPTLHQSRKREFSISILMNLKTSSLAMEVCF